MEHSTHSEDNNSKNSNEKKPKKTRVLLSGFDLETKDRSFKKKLRDINKFIVKKEK